MKKLAALLLLAALTVGGLLPASAQSRNTYSQPTDVRKLEKKQQKAQKKYAKAQKKAERKMLKTERKHTHYPPRQY